MKKSGPTSARRLTFLLWGSLLFALMVYVFAVRNTLALVSDNAMLEGQLSALENAPVQIRELKAELDRMDRQLQKYEAGNGREDVLEKVAGYCNREGVVLSSFPAPAMETEGNLEMNTRRIVVEGSFAKLLGLAYILEQSQQGGRVSSLQFQTVDDARSRRTYLLATIYLQNIRKVEEDT